jgi:hypothetical protein
MAIFSHFHWVVIPAEAGIQTFFATSAPCHSRGGGNPGFFYCFIFSNLTFFHFHLSGKVEPKQRAMKILVWL